MKSKNDTSTNTSKLVGCYLHTMYKICVRVTTIMTQTLHWCTSVLITSFPSDVSHECYQLACICLGTFSHICEVITICVHKQRASFTSGVRRFEQKQCPRASRILCVVQCATRASYIAQLVRRTPQTSIHLPEQLWFSRPFQLDRVYVYAPSNSSASSISSIACICSKQQ